MITNGPCIFGSHHVQLLVRHDRLGSIWLPRARYGSPTTALGPSRDIGVSAGARYCANLSRSRSNNCPRVAHPSPDCVPALIGSTACRGRLQRALQKPEDRRRDGRPVAPDLTFERVARPEVTS